MFIMAVGFMDDKQPFSQNNVTVYITHICTLCMMHSLGPRYIFFNIFSDSVLLLYVQDWMYLLSPLVRLVSQSPANSLISIYRYMKHHCGVFFQKGFQYVSRSIATIQVYMMNSHILQ